MKKDGAFHSIRVGVGHLCAPRWLPSLDTVTVISLSLPCLTYPPSEIGGVACLRGARVPSDWRSRLLDWLRAVRERVESCLHLPVSLGGGCPAGYVRARAPRRAHGAHFQLNGGSVLFARHCECDRGPVRGLRHDRERIWPGPEAAARGKRRAARLRVRGSRDARKRYEQDTRDGELGSTGNGGGAHHFRSERHRELNDVDGHLFDGAGKLWCGNLHDPHGVRVVQ